MNFRPATIAPLQPGIARYPAMETPNLANKSRGLNWVLTFLVLILGMVNIGIVGYNFSYFKGTWRHNLFHSELTFIVIFIACFIGTIVNVLGNLISPNLENTIHEKVGSVVFGLLAGLAATILLIQLSVYRRYWVDAFPTKVFSGILGLVEALIYLVNALVLHKSVQNVT